MARRKTVNQTRINRLNNIPYHDAWVAYKCVSCHEMNYIQVGQTLLSPSHAVENCVWTCEHCGFVHAKESDLPFQNWEEEFLNADSTTVLRFWEGFLRIATENPESYWKQCNCWNHDSKYKAFRETCKKLVYFRDL